MKAHTGKYRIVPGKPLDPQLAAENVADVEAGAANMIRHIENVRKFGVTPVVAINAFHTDTADEIAAVKRIAEEAGAYGVALAEHWAKGGAGAAELAELVVSACETPNDFRFLYELEQPIKAKIERIATEIYRADGVDYTPLAERQIRQFEADGLGALPICMAKTHLSFTADPKRVGAPDGFRLPISEVRAMAGAGFIYPLCGDIRTMPGLGESPAAQHVDIDAQGRIVGLF